MTETKKPRTRSRKKAEAVQPEPPKISRQVCRAAERRERKMTRNEHGRKYPKPNHERGFFHSLARAPR